MWGRVHVHLYPTCTTDRPPTTNSSGLCAGGYRLAPNPPEQDGELAGRPVSGVDAGTDDLAPPSLGVSIRADSVRTRLRGWGAWLACAALDRERREGGKSGPDFVEYRI